jgi:hypothetical protein
VRIGLPRLDIDGVLRVISEAVRGKKYFTATAPNGIKVDLSLWLNLL